MFTSARNKSRGSVARFCVRCHSAVDAFYNVVQPFATSSLSMLTPAIWSRAWAGVAKRTRGGCPRREELSTSVRNMSRCSVARLCMRSQSALDAFYNVVQAFATSSLSMLTPAIWCRAWAGVAKRTCGVCPRREELFTSVLNLSRCSVARLCMRCQRFT